MTPKEHLEYLLRLAAEPGERHQLVRELSDLLGAWPPGYPDELRPPFAALLARIEHDIDPEDRRELAAKLAHCPDAPLPLLNEFFFDLPPDARAGVLQRNARLQTERCDFVNETVLVAAARARRSAEFSGAFSTAFGIDALTAAEILQDGSGLGVAIACRGAGLSRAAFSAIVLLTARGDVGNKLSALDAVPAEGAATLLAFWRKHNTSHDVRQQAA
ncbi:MAG TPA: DUF2336 domain-containing protein [Rhizomicrobium sp.]|jgi:uncharacterized protein (DUF2336 family)